MLAVIPLEEINDYEENEGLDSTLQVQTLEPSRQVTDREHGQLPDNSMVIQ